MRRKLLMLSVCCLVLVFMLAPFVSAKNYKVRSRPAGKSNVGHLYLYEKETVGWTVIENGAWGKMKYSLSGSSFNFVFNGKKSIPGEQYTLIYYPDPWPGLGLICLGTGTANGGGNINIQGSVIMETSLPIPEDLNSPENSDHDTCIADSTCIDGAKIWMVLSNDVDCIEQEMTSWNPADYLFEDMGIFFTYVPE